MEGKIKLGEAASAMNTCTSNDKKLSYEQLENVAHQLSEQVKWAKNELDKMYFINSSKRLDYLFKVLEYAPMFDRDFVKLCSVEISESLTLQNEEDTDNA